MSHRFALYLSMLCSAAIANAASISVSKLKCEYAEKPLGIDAAAPRLSWVVESEQRGQKQTAYQVLVASAMELLRQDRGDLWDSGKMVSDQSAQIAFAGKALRSNQQCFWKIRVWDKDGKPTAWSDAATWTMGLLKSEDWKAKWIGSPSKAKGLPLFRREFEVAKEIRRAEVHICGLGQFELHLNGGKVGDSVFEPVWSNYRKTCYYVTYDVTPILRQGRNAVGVMLGNGMYNVTGGRYVKFTGSFGQPRLIARIHIEFTDGTAQVIASDESWKTAPGPILFSCIFGGEDYDARQELSGWDSPGFEDSKWANAALADGGSARLAHQPMPPIKVMRSFKTVKITEPKAGIRVYDLGQNLSGWPVLRVRGPAGAVVKMIPGELLDRTGLVSQRSSGGPMWFSYTLKGNGEEAWRPRFSYYGFRYVQVETTSPTAQSPEILDLGSEWIHCSAPMTGSFECSNPLVNDIHKLINAAVLSNFQSVVTDCPHREKLGWLEVSHLMGRAIMYNYDVPGYYAKIVDDMREAQTPEGLVPDIAPEYTVFSGGFRDSPEWGSAYVINPWFVYQIYGDRSLLEKHYEGMKAYVSYLKSTASGHIVSHGLGDWYDIGPRGPGESQLTSKGLTATAIYYHDIDILRKTAEVLGKMEDAEAYARLAKEVKAVFTRRFFDRDTNSYDRNSQTANAMPLVVGLVDEDKQAAVLDAIVKDVRGRGNRVTAGDVGFMFLVRALSEGGRGDVLYDMVCQKDGPGYLDQLRKGATTLTEAWDANPASSQNHCMLGHAEEWFYSGLGGIRPDPAGRGFARIIIRPQMVGDLKWVKCRYDSIRGQIESNWTREGDRVELNLVIPVGSMATVYVPAADAGSVTESGKPAAQADSVRFVRMEQACAVFVVESGRYSFVSKR